MKRKIEKDKERVHSSENNRQSEFDSRVILTYL